VVIVDDSGIEGCIDDSLKHIPEDIETKVLYNSENIGQIKSIDKAYSYVETEYIFHCEDDWEFYNGGFIEKSIDILTHDPKIFCVWLRAYNDINNHPLTSIYNDKYRIVVPTRYVHDQKLYEWFGYTFNPGLRRKKDYDVVKPFVESCKPYFHNNAPDEIDIQKIYKKMDMVAAITLNRSGYIKHIGENQHIKRKWDKK
jgi:hypothetical protein